MAEHAVPLDDRPYDRAMSAPRTRRVRITVRLDPERMKRARKAVKKGYAPSINAWIEEAVRRMDNSYGWCETREEWEEAFAEYVREFDPPLTQEELARARRIWFEEFET
jgi:Arc/MetJ-type ribon-helix-helix transcriptional regulator